MFKRIRDGLRSKDQSSKLADLALKDEVAGLDLISSLGSTDEGVREVSSKAILEVSKRDYGKLLKLVSRWSGDRHYKLATFLKWTEGLQSKSFDKLRGILIGKMRSASAVDQLVNEQDEVSQKLTKLKEYFAQKQVSEPVFETLKAEYESKLGAATKRLLTQFLGHAGSLEELMQQRFRIRNELSVLQTRASLGELGRKEIEVKRADLNKQIEDIQEKDRKLSEELSVMLMSSGPINIYDENGGIVALASDFSVDREKPAVELKARLLSREDIQSGQLSDNRNELIALVYNLVNKPAEAPSLTSDSLTPDVIDRVGSTVASELKIGSEEALQVEKLKFFIELTSWRSGKIRSVTIPAKGLTPTEKGFIVRPGTIGTGKAESAGVGKPVERLSRTVEAHWKSAESSARPVETSARRMEVPARSVELPSESEELLSNPEVEAEPINAAPAPETAMREVPGLSSMPPTKEEAEGKAMQRQFESIDQELETEIKSLQQVLDEEEGKGKVDKEAIIGVDDKVLSEIDKAAQKLREKMRR